MTIKYMKQNNIKIDWLTYEKMKRWIDDFLITYLFIVSWLLVLIFWYEKL